MSAIPMTSEQTGFFNENAERLRDEIEATRRYYWRLVAELRKLDSGAITKLAQLVDSEGNVYFYNGDSNAPFGCGQLVGKVTPHRAGWDGWGLDAAPPPFRPPPFQPPKPKRGRRRAL